MSPDHDPTAVYEHRQWGWVGVVIAAVIVGVLVLAAGISGNSQVYAGALTAAVVGVIVTAIFGALRVHVTDDEVSVSFLLGWPRRTVGFTDVAAVRQVRNSWWHGWGYRFIPNGRMFNVSGLDAVELELTTGKVFRIGTDDPSGLMAAFARVLPDRTESDAAGR